MTVEELTNTIQEFYQYLQDKQRTVIQMTQPTDETLSTLIYLLYIHSKTGTPLSTQILRVIGDTKDDGEFEEILEEMED